MAVILEMVVAGLFFGAWPLFMNRSGLNATSASLLFTVVVLIALLPTTLYQDVSLSGHKWWFGVAAGVCSGVALLAFNDGLSKTTPAQVGKMFIIMLVVQTAVPALYHVIYNHQLSVKTLLGFITALATIFLLG